MRYVSWAELVQSVVVMRSRAVWLDRRRMSWHGALFSGSLVTRYPGISKATTDLQYTLVCLIPYETRLDSLYYVNAIRSCAMIKIVLRGFSPSR